MDMKKLKEKANSMDPILRIGKSGITENVIKDIGKHLKKRGLIKIKFLRSFISKTEKKEAAEKIISMTDSRLVSAVGNVIVIVREVYFQKSLNKASTK